MFSSKWCSLERRWGYFTLSLFRLLVTVERKLSWCFYLDRTYDTQSLRLNCGCGIVHVSWVWRRKHSSDWSYSDKKYGFDVHSGSIYFHWKNKLMGWDFPFITWNHYTTEYMDVNNEWQENRCWNKFSTDTDSNVLTEQHPVFYELRSGDIQWRVATCTQTRMTWRRKWMPWSKMVKVKLDVKFNQEIGNEAGSWKGGVTGTSHEMRPGESIPECLDRMLAERNF